MEPFTLGGATVLPGERKTVNLSVAKLYTNSPVEVPVVVQHGSEPGPVMFVSAALHGDEINGVEIIRRVLKIPQLSEIRGTLLAVPVLNTLAFIHQSRYMPDRRDLNRSFPGSERGSFAARLAWIFLKEVVGRSDFGMDLHTGAIHRPNLPQIRADLRNPTNARLARAFGAPVILDSRPAPGTLREYTTAQNIPAILYESGEALRFDETCIRLGAQGVLNVMREMNMIKLDDESMSEVQADPVFANASRWVRAPESGILRQHVGLGDHVRKGDLLGIIGDPFGDAECEVLASDEGIIIGRLNLPLIHEGDAIFHIGIVDAPADVAQAVGQMDSGLLPWMDEEPPIV